MQRSRTQSHTTSRGSPINSAGGLRNEAFDRTYYHARPERVGLTVSDDRYTWITF
jgi:hypothetical protein